MREIVEWELDLGVVNWFLKNLAIHLEKAGPDRLGLCHHATDCLFKHIPFNGTLDYGMCDYMPFFIKAARLLSKPDVELPARERQCLVINFHRTHRTRTV
ncbi:hypothetical protein MBRA_32320 [Mycobacterium branderi]|uniref:Uncharacterized protein n=1 Tax=Mycobacterium branderi TaxID=43348 RepID=A0ABM7KPH4_9MYCO|nr:hypothetical protein MBRA_32320 [Mycobacterium branderi]